VLSLGCGAAPEVQRFLRKRGEGFDAEFTLLDFSAPTLEYAGARISEAARESGREANCSLHEFSVQQVLTNGSRLLNNPRMIRSGLLERDRYDVLYCVGLFDYLSERICTRVLRVLWELGVPGASVIASNFTPQNPMKAFMDYVLDWRLLHRDEGAVGALAVDPELRPDARTVAAPGGAEVFLHMRKPG
jgi:extracellular factor (EF) 3-hydroxypalmitic acid methyl ester biosynthesis protein